MKINLHWLTSCNSHIYREVIVGPVLKFSSFIRLPWVLLCLVSSCPARARNVVVIAPHPDDEALMAAGVIYSAVHNGDNVNVVVVTNGDYHGADRAQVREGETVAAMKELGLAEDHVIFLGYGDGTLWELWQNSSPTAVLASPAGVRRTYASRGLGRTDYHGYLYHRPGNYNRNTLLNDITALLKSYHPDDVYTTSFYDDHRDHRATNAFVVAAMVALERAPSPIRARLHETFVHSPGSCHIDPQCSSRGWPRPVFTPAAPFPRPPEIESTPYRWDQIESISVPVEMQDADPTRNIKYRAIADYPSQAPPPGHSNWLQAFVKKDEFFWVRDFPADLALRAKISVSSENRAAQQFGSNVADGMVAGEPLDPHSEWASLQQFAGAWVKLTWAFPVRLSRVVLHGRPSPSARIVDGTLLFSDGSQISVGALPENGVGLPVAFRPKIVDWLEFRIDHSSGHSAGLAEFEAFGVPVNSPSPGLPIIAKGPVAVPDSVESLAASKLQVDAFNPDGGELSYSWEVDGGSIAASGSAAVFRAPVVTDEKVFTITVTVGGSHSGYLRNSTFVRVYPRPTFLYRLKVWLSGGDGLPGDSLLHRLKLWVRRAEELLKHQLRRLP